MSNDATIGIIGGSGLYQMEGLNVLAERKVETPFGDPSDAYVIGEIDGVRVAFLSRHGRGHCLTPSELNYRANIFGFKLLGVQTVLSASAVGSMKEEYAPTDIVFPYQFIDRTRHRPDTFFGNGIVAHVGFADPICLGASLTMSAVARSIGARVHDGGVYLCMEGPQFSTRAESDMHRAWGGDLIGMTLMPEAKLAREAEICYAAVALATDYDCWRKRPHDNEAEKDGDKLRLLEEIIGNVKVATQNALSLIGMALPALAAQAEKPCDCQSALRLGIWSDKSRIADDVKERLGLIIGKYMDS
jgi:5'-methylthioadenosine phosphorylase